MRGGTNRTLWHFVIRKESIFIEPFRWKFDRNFPRPSKNPLRASASMIPDGTKVEGETRNGTRPRFLSFLFRIEACRSWSQSSGLAMRSHRRKRSLSDSSPSDTIDEASRSLSKGIPFQNFERGDERRIARLEAFPSPFRVRIRVSTNKDPEYILLIYVVLVKYGREFSRGGVPFFILLFFC